MPDSNLGGLDKMSEPYKLNHPPLADFCFSFVYILFAALYIGNGSCSMYTDI